MLVTGVLVGTLGLAMLLPALVDLAADNDDWMIFVSAAMVTMLFGFGLFIANRGAPKGLSTRQAMLMTVVSWVALVAFGALPFHWSGIVPTYTDAFFESMSGLTTTGATVITGLDSTPVGLLFWRGLLQWLGGLGIIVMAIAVLPMLQIGGMQLFKAEAFDTAEKILPRAAQISTSITLVFIAMTGLSAVAYMAVGMAADDAVIHAMTTVATGGFSTKDASIGAFNNPGVEWVAIVFMTLGSIPFLLYVQMLQGKFRPFLADEQVKAFLAFLGVAILMAWMMAHFGKFHVGLEGLRHSAFNVVSIVTGTGYSSTDYGLWGSHAVAFFFIIMFAGGCAGSTSCGIKIFRFQVLFEAVRQHIAQVMYPHGVFRAHFNGKPIEDRVVASVMSFFFLFMASFVVLALLLRFSGLDTITALSGAGTALSNVGPGLGDIIGPAGNFQSLSDVQKWLLAAGMLLGRLELFTVLVLFLPRFWRS
ncbi:TrkH family potassium uptake protein [Hoeflea sp. G2-23]|uniref:Trk system potassium uptake protein n=1 Tax=Hoeflea algicola TaxID=2983763 RepID=A0ABT3ZD86_9HYPH|nr:TrkH family potassium uptake protein [Hoeflea algicola]MCY0149765.1 TrkH family potassium uptake protein [Hoeflea algicola]